MQWSVHIHTIKTHVAYKKERLHAITFWEWTLAHVNFQILQGTVGSVHSNYYNARLYGF